VPFDDTELKVVDPDEGGVGEILTRHGGLFAGYFGDEAASRDAFGEDGWLRTGDAGFLDGKGRLTVIDRVKDIARTSAGARFSPQFVENKLKFSPFIGECVVLGQERPHLAAILCLRYSMVARWAEGRRIAFTTYHNLSEHPDVLALLAAEVEQVNASLPEPQRIRRFVSLYKELDPDDGELTRTRKVRRSVIDERYGRIIEAIYAGLPRVQLETEVTFEDGRKGRSFYPIISILLSLSISMTHLLPAFGQIDTSFIDDEPNCTLSENEWNTDCHCGTIAIPPNISLSSKFGFPNGTIKTEPDSENTPYGSYGYLNVYHRCSDDENVLVGSNVRKCIKANWIGPVPRCGNYKHALLLFQLGTHIPVGTFIYLKL
jgi:hypothetical protein